MFLEITNALLLTLLCVIIVHYTSMEYKENKMSTLTEQEIRLRMVEVTLKNIGNRHSMSNYQIEQNLLKFEQYVTTGSFETGKEKLRELLNK